MVIFVVFFSLVFFVFFFGCKTKFPGITTKKTLVLNENPNRLKINKYNILRLYTHICSAGRFGTKQMRGLKKENKRVFLEVFSEMSFIGRTLIVFALVNTQTHNFNTRVRRACKTEGDGGGGGGGSSGSDGVRGVRGVETVL